MTEAQLLMIAEMESEDTTAMTYSVADDNS